jgi:carboxyl-terminal processing protease
LTVAREIGISFTVAVEPGSPGEQAGVQPGDVIAEVNGRSTREMALWELQTLLAAGSTSLEMKLLRQGKSVDVELSLGPFTREIPSVVVEEGIPVLRIAAFTGATSGQVAALLSAPNIADSDRLVLDVRGVAGGTVEAAFDVAGFFMQGPLGELRDRSGSIASYTGEAQPQWSGRMAILVDRGCQGPCEVLTAALKDAPGIEIVGAPTFGLAGRFASREMSTGATLFFTDAFYAGPDGEPIDSSLEPEVGVQASRQTLGGVENLPADPVLQRALDLLREEERQAA